ncbi:MAG: HTH domain-containing protein [Candidatus Zixiibacteriota bacterium]|nr:MAG: HTH domain-containing protein [candidate division Zixibacteria bacterium]
MSKTERLFRLIDLLQNGRSLTMQQICHECRISNRTAYRYLSTLSRLRVPIRYDGAYSVADSNGGSSIRGLSADEREILRFCLRQNPLLEFSYFRKLMARIERDTMGRLTDSKPSDKSTILVRAKRRKPGFRSNGTDRSLAVFIKAVIDKRPVRIARTNVPDQITCKPLAVKLTDKGPSLVILLPGRKRPVDIPLAQVRCVSVTTTGKS